MSEIENTTSLAEDDEISLIDLFSVLIRYRMMIIIGSAIVFVLTALYRFIMPLADKVFRYQSSCFIVITTDAVS